MSAFDFSGLSNTTTWSDSNFAQDTTTYTQGQVVSETANGALHCVVSSTGGTGTMRAKLINRTWATTVGAKITANGVRGFTVIDDGVAVCLLVETGANAWKGYTWRLGNAFQRLGRLDLANDDDPGSVGNAWLAAPTGDAIAEGDTFELTLNTSTGVLIGKHNGTQITTATDTTYPAVVSAFAVVAGNHGGTGVSRLDTTGDSFGTAIATNAGSIAVTGNQATATPANNTVIQTFVA